MQQQYSLERMHSEKFWGERRAGKTVDAIAAAIGAVMVLDGEPVYYVVKLMNRFRHVSHEFLSLVENHHKEKPRIDRQFQLSIEGFKSKIYVVSLMEWERKYQYRCTTVPIFDLD